MPGGSAVNCRRYYYQHHGSYGSPETDSQPVGITAATLSPDKRTVSLTLDKLVPGYVYEFTPGAIRSGNGAKKPANRMLFYTLNRLK